MHIFKTKVVEPLIRIRYRNWFYRFYRVVTYVDSVLLSKHQFLSFVHFRPFEDKETFLRNIAYLCKRLRMRIPNIVTVLV